MILLEIQAPIHKPKADTANKRDDRHGAIIPHQQRISRHAYESFADSGRNGGREERDGHDERAHVDGGFGEGVFERGDGGEDLGDGDQDVGACLCPDVDVDCGAGFLAVAAEGGGERAGGVVATDGFLVDVGLDYGGPDHGGAAGEETCCDLCGVLLVGVRKGGSKKVRTLDGREVDLGLAESWVDE